MPGFGLGIKNGPFNEHCEGGHQFLSERFCRCHIGILEMRDTFLHRNLIIIVTVIWYCHHVSNSQLSFSMVISCRHLDGLC